MALGALAEEVRHASTRGWRLLPVKQRAKTPLVREWQKVATNNLDPLEAWANKFPGCNWGLATGHDSGVFALDVDGQTGEDALLAYRREGRQLPNTLTVITGRGRHLYFRWPGAQHISNSRGRLAAGLDIRGEGGQVVIPPSVHSTGFQYVYADQDAPIAHAPKWLLDIVAQPRHVYVSILRDGQRNDALTRLAGAWRRRGAMQDELDRRLRAENFRRCRPPLEDSEVKRIAASIASRYAPGGPDPLEIAWQHVLAETHSSTYNKLLALARHLQLARPGFPIALPQVRIGKLMGCDPTLVSRYRRRAVAKGRIVEVKKYVMQRVAGTFTVPNPNEMGVPLASPTSI